MRITRRTRRFCVGVIVTLVWTAAFTWGENMDSVLPAQRPDIDATADVLEFTRHSNILSAIGNVKIKYRDVILEADEVSLNTESRDFSAKGDVKLFHAEYTWQGESVSGNLDKKTFEFGRYLAMSDPWLVVGSNAFRNVNGNIIVSNAQASTCSYLFEDQSHWRIQSDKMLYYPDGSFKAYNVLYKVANIPVFYLPVIWGKTSQRSGQMHISTGFKDDFGFILDIAKDWNFKNVVDSRTGLTYRTKRGLALYNQSRASSENSRTEFLAYGMHDDEPLSDTTVNGEEFNGRFESETDRFRLKLEHHSNLSERLTLTANLDYVSDHLFLLEFFKKDFNRDPQPVSFVELGYVGDYFELTLNYRPRLNDFESVVERQPELRLAMPRLSLGKTNVYFQNETTAAQLHMNWRELDLPREGGLSDPGDYLTERFDSVNFLYYPFAIRMLSLTPRIGGRVTYYTRSSRKKVSEEQLNSNFLADDPRPTLDNPNPVFNYDDDGGDRLRFALELGLELSFKSSRTWSNVQSNRWNVSGLRHVVQPFVNYTYIPKPNVDNDHLFFFDEVDRIDKLNFVRLGTRHQFRTRRNNKIYTLSRMENFLDVYISPEKRREHAGDFGTTFELNPDSSVSFWSNILVDTNKGNVNVVHAGASLGKEDEMKLDFSYLYRQSFVSRFNYSMGSEITQILTNSFIPTDFERNHGLNLNVHVPMGAKSDLRVAYFFDLDRGKVGRQTYELTRDLHCWIGALRFEEEADEISVLLIFSLKAFPKFRFDLGG